MYKIIGADQREYGPVSAEQLRQWIAEGRAGPQSRVCLEGTTDWKSLAEFPEFADALATASSQTPPLPPSAAHTGLSPENLERDYELDIGRCLSNAWDL